MSEEDFDLDAVLDEVSVDVKSANKKQKKRRVVGNNSGNDDFNFDFDVDETKATKTKKTKKPKDTKNTNGNSDSSDSDAPDGEQDANGKKVKRQKSTKGKRIMDLDGLDFGNISFDTSNDTEKESKKQNKIASKGKAKRRSIVGNEYDVLEEELEKIQEIQKQIKTNKSSQDKDRREEKEAESRKRFQNIFRILILLILIMSIALSYLIIKRNNLEMNTKRIKIEQPVNVANGSNYIFVDAKLKIEDENLEIKKIRLDSQELAVYLDKPVDFEKYKFHVLDDQLNRYYETTNYDQKFVKGQETKLTFEPLLVDTKKFSVRVENIETGYFAETIFELEEPLKYPLAKYYYNVAPVDPSLYVSSSVFSSAFTKTVLVANGEKEDIESIAKGNIEKGNLYINHKNEDVPINSGEIDYAYFEEYNKGISVIQNNPLKSLQGSVKFGAKNVNKQKKVDANLDVFSLNMGKKVKDNIDDNSVTLEGIYNYDGVVVIPMHGEKVNAIPSNPKVTYDVTSTGRYEPKVIEATDDETYNQIAVQMDATLTAKDENGEEFEVVGECKVGVGGTDVIFQDERLKGVSLNDMEIFVRSYSTVEDGFERTLNLQYVQNEPKNTDDEFKQFVKESFESRLKYKSKEITKNYITGFDENITTNFLSSGKYVPVDTMTTAYYSVNLVGFAVEGSNYFAIVDESWIAKGKDGVVMRMENRHKIVAEKQGRDFKIVYDKIITENK